MHEPSEATRVLKSLFPEPLRVAVWAPGQTTPPVFPEERTALAGSVERRRIEFARGRACARDALTQLGFRPSPIPVGPGRQPIWPEGAVGSIAHCDSLVAAVAGRATDVCGVGIDIEVGQALKNDLVDAVCTPKEVAAVRSARPHEVDAWCTMIFSAKESVHKVVYPRTSIWLDFLDVEISLDLAENSFTVHPVSVSSAVIVTLVALRGRFRFLNGLVATGVTLPADSTVSA